MVNPDENAMDNAIAGFAWGMLPGIVAAAIAAGTGIAAGMAVGVAAGVAVAEGIVLSYRPFEEVVDEWAREISMKWGMPWAEGAVRVLLTRTPTGSYGSISEVTRELGLDWVKSKLGG